MKAFFTLFSFLVAAATLQAQYSAAPDTLVKERFETDPTPFMLPFPSGDDQDWVNYDGDMMEGNCVVDDITPPAWYWESDLGAENAEEATNSAFTSCSWLDTTGIRTDNWLIVKPIFIPDDSYWLCWRSLTFEGPRFVDGYKVLVSKTSNEPAANVFTDTLFKAAETINAPTFFTLDVSKFKYSEGYIHANGYTDTNYYFIAYDDAGFPYYRGKMEPHSVSLHQYANETIYIAFLHDSYDDHLLQLDDIIVTNSPPPSSTHLIGNMLYFNVLPNPVQDKAYFSWKMKTPQEGRLLVADSAGRIVSQQAFGSRAEGQVFVETQRWASGIYYCTLETAAGRATTKLVKM